MSARDEEQNTMSSPKGLDTELYTKVLVLYNDCWIQNTPSYTCKKHIHGEEENLRNDMFYTMTAGYRTLLVTPVRNIFTARKRTFETTCTTLIAVTIEFCRH